MGLDGDPDATILQEPAYDGGERRAAAITEQEDEARAPEDDDQGRHSTQIGWPERRAQKGAQEKPGQDHGAHPVLVEGATDVRRKARSAAGASRGRDLVSGSPTYHAVQPAPTTRFQPVMYDEASDARNNSAPQYSSRCAILPRGALLL